RASRMPAPTPTCAGCTEVRHEPDPRRVAPLATAGDRGGHRLPDLAAGTGPDAVRGRRHAGLSGRPAGRPAGTAWAEPDMGGHDRLRGTAGGRGRRAAAADTADRAPGREPGQQPAALRRLGAERRVALAAGAVASGPAHLRQRSPAA